MITKLLFFEYNSKKYNSAGKVVNTVPTSIGTFNFDFSSAQTGIKIFIAGYQVTNQNINQVVGQALKVVVGATPGFLERNDIIKKANDKTT